jgi:hypothetical protein
LPQNVDNNEKDVNDDDKSSGATPNLWLHMLQRNPDLPTRFLCHKTYLFVNDDMAEKYSVCF